MNLYDGRAKLCYALEKLRLRWEETKPDWRDAVSRDFQRDFLEPLEPQVAGTVQAIEKLSEILSRAEKECSDRKMDL